MFCSESSPVLYIAKFSVSNTLKAPKVRVWHSDRMCLNHKYQAARSETTATRSENMSPVSSEATKQQPPALTTRYVGRTSCRAYRRRIVVSKDQKSPLPKPVKSEVTASPVMPVAPKPTETPGSSSSTGPQKNAFLTTDKAYLLLEYKKPSHKSDETHNKIAVPLCYKKPYKNLSKMEKTEYMDEDVFIARHKKCEKEERRSKRQDSRLIREQNATEKQKNASEKLKNKQSQKPKNSVVRKSQSFYPDLEKLEFLEVTEELPVLAFGYPIPYFDSSEFSLPWQAEGVTDAPKAKRGRPSVT